MNLPIENNDDQVLGMLSGANFGPNAKIILPSGAELTGDEAAAFTAAFGKACRPVSPEGDARVNESRGEADEFSQIVSGSRTRPGKETVFPEKIRSNQMVDPDNPLSSVNDDWTGDPQVDLVRLVAHAHLAAEQSLAKPRRRWLGFLRK